MTISAAGVPAAFTEGDSATISVLATFADNTPSVPSDYAVSIDWGDGTSPTPGLVSQAGNTYFIRAGHVYAEQTPGNAPLPVSVTIAETGNGNDNASVNTTATVAGAPLIPSAVTDSPFEPEGVHSATSAANISLGTITPQPVNFTPTEGAPYQGPVATFTDNEPGVAASNFAATINWADGTVTPGIVTGAVNGPITVSGAHTYADERAFQPVIKIGGIGGQFSNVTDNIQVREGDVLAPAGTPSIMAAVGSQFSGVVATFSDSYLANLGKDFTASIAWGDGAVTQGVVTGGSGTLVVSGTHAYATAKTFKLQVTIDESTPGTASSTAIGSATILRVGPTPQIMATPQRSLAGTFGAVVPQHNSKPLHRHDLALRHLGVESIKHRGHR